MYHASSHYINTDLASSATRDANAFNKIKGLTVIL